MSIKSMFVKGISKTGLWVARHKSELFLGVGLLSGGACVVTACMGTLKLPEVIDEAKVKIDDIHKEVEDPETDYSQQDSAKDLMKVYGKTAFDVAKLYILPASLGVISVGCLVSGHNVLRKENLAWAGAYGALSEGFSKYRKRVVDEYGQEKDMEFYTGRKKVCDVQVIDPETGETKLEPVYQQIDIPAGPYSILFDETNPNWCRNDPEMNKLFVKQAFVRLQASMRARGYITYNEIREYFGLPPVNYGFIMGKFDPKGVEYLDFDVLRKENYATFVNQIDSGMGVWITFDLDPMPVSESMKIEEDKKQHEWQMLN